MSIISLFKNKVLFYLASRYITYGVQFITSLVIAAQLGPYYLGVWGFILLLLQYFQQFHFGIANSFNVLYVQHKNSQQECDNYIANSLVLVGFLAVFVVAFYVYYLIVGIGRFEKYHVDDYMVWICLVAIFQYYVNFFINLFRVKNQLNKVTFCQSIIIFLNFFCVFFFKDEELIKWLLSGYVVGNLLCVILALTSKAIPSFRTVTIRRHYQNEIIKKGIFLFLYNTCFYFIIIAIRTIISGNYSVEEFGLFTFSYTLASAILLILDSLSFIIFPKVISKLSSNIIDEVEETLSVLRKTYITSAHLLIYLALICFPFLLLIMPKYSNALTCVNLISLTVLMSSSSFGYMELLVSKNKERTMAVLSSIALVINCIIALILVLILKVAFSYVILSTMLTYYIYTFLVITYGQKAINRGKMVDVLKDHLPLRLLLPYIVALVVSLLKLEYLIWLPLVVFVLMNIRELNTIKETINKIIIRPEVVNL